MNSLDFCYWLRGYFEINGEQAITKKQAEIISKHLTLVFEEKAKDLEPVSEADVLRARGKEVVCSPKTIVPSIEDLIKRRKVADKWVHTPAPFDTKVTITCDSSAEELANEFKEALSGFTNSSSTYSTPPTVSCCAGGQRYC
jgi:hypothetical protein